MTPESDAMRKRICAKGVSEERARQAWEAACGDRRNGSRLVSSVVVEHIAQAIREAETEAGRRARRQAFQDARAWLESDEAPEWGGTGPMVCADLATGLIAWMFRQEKEDTAGASDTVGVRAEEEAGEGEKT